MVLEAFGNMLVFAHVTDSNMLFNFLLFLSGLIA
jgi:hypothetical protein